MDNHEEENFIKTLQNHFCNFCEDQTQTPALLKDFLKDKMLIENETELKYQSNIKAFLDSDAIQKLLNSSFHDPNETKEFLKSIYKMFPNRHIKSWNSFLDSIVLFDDSKDYFSSIFERRFPIGTISYIGARPGRGKTTILVNIALDALKKNKPVIFITAEETTKQILTRFILSETCGNNLTDIWTVSESTKPRTALFNYIKDIQNNLNMGQVTNSEHFEKAFCTIQNYIETKKLTIFEAYGATWNELKDFLTQQESGSIILVDYIQHLKSPENLVTQQRQVQIQEISHQLADLSGVHGLITISGAQFIRPKQESQKAIEEELTKPDSFNETSFREAGDIEQDGHILIGIGKNPKTDELFYSCMKDREATPDNGKCWKLKKNMAFSFLQGEKNDKGEKMEYNPTPTTPPPPPPKKGSDNQNKEKINAMKNFRYGSK